MLSVRELRYALFLLPDSAHDEPVDLPGLLALATGDQDFPERLAGLLVRLADPDTHDIATAVESHALVEMFGWA